MKLNQWRKSYAVAAAERVDAATNVKGTD